MKTTKVLIDFKDMRLVEAIQKYADLHCDGNYTQAVRRMAKKALTDEDFK